MKIVIEKTGRNIEFYLSENYKNLDEKEKLEKVIGRKKTLPLSFIAIHRACLML